MSISAALHTFKPIGGIQNFRSVSATVIVTVSASLRRVMTGHLAAIADPSRKNDVQT